MTRLKPWRSWPIFISSTFLDMHAERDYLTDYVFLALEEKLRKHRYYLEPIDLRWGVEADSADSALQKQVVVLRRCLTDILDNNPFVIVLLGDRYGFIPAAEVVIQATQGLGYSGEVRGQSITALEIAFSLLAQQDTHPRIRFYLRNPLPYSQMDEEVAAKYSDLFAGRPVEYQQVQALKRRIMHEFTGLVRNYEAGWDENLNKVTGLKEWGSLVQEDLFKEIDETLTEDEPVSPTSWQNEERWLLEEFISNHSNNFIGRKEMIEQILTMATALTEEATWAVSISGDSGAGKSALFAHVYQNLSSDVLLLAHAAGISLRSTSIERMVSRWCEELAVHLGEGANFTAPGDRENLERVFAELLSRVAVNTRVVLMIDALNEFEETPCALAGSWVPELWPTNARLITTTIPCRISEVLEQRQGVTQIALPPLSKAEAAEMIKSIYRQYHKDTYQPVLKSLLTKQTEEQPSAGNPLWLQLAIWDLLLLDEDSFLAARRFSDDPEDQIHAMLVNTTEKLAADIPSLYQNLLNRNVKVYGLAWTKGLTSLLAVTRGGLRDSDLRQLLPEIIHEPWDIFQFTALRRGFRNHIVLKGTYGQWDFSHAQAREAVGMLYLSDEAYCKNLHHILANYLERLPADDPIRETELMYHMIKSGDRLRTARYYLSLSEGEEYWEATTAMASHLVRLVSINDNQALEWICDLLEVPLTEASLQTLCKNISEGLINYLYDKVKIEFLLELAKKLKIVLEKLLQINPHQQSLARDLAAVCVQVGDLQMNTESPQYALGEYQKALQIVTGLDKNTPEHEQYMQDLSTIYERLGDFHVKVGELEVGQRYFEQELAIWQRLRFEAPQKTAYAFGMFNAYLRLGDLGLDDNPLRYFNSGLKILQELWEREPNNSDLIRNSAVIYEKLALAKVAEAPGDPRKYYDPAVSSYEQALFYRQRLHWLEPENTQYTLELVDIYLQLGDFYLQLKPRGQTQKYYQEGLLILRDIRKRVPDSLRIENYFLIFTEQMGDLSEELGELSEAKSYYQQALEARERLCLRIPHNVEYKRGLWADYLRMGYISHELQELAMARVYYLRGIKIGKSLARLMAQSEQILYYLAVSYNKLGHYYWKMGLLKKAKPFYKKGLKVSRELSCIRPDNIQYHCDLAANCQRLGEISAELSEYPKAVQYFTSALAINEELHKFEPADSRYAFEIWQNSQALGKLTYAEGYIDQAKQYFDLGVAIACELVQKAPGQGYYTYDKTFWEERLKGEI